MAITCYRCRDCGERGREIKRPNPIRADICDECWNLRVLLVQAMKEGRISQGDFSRYQRSRSRAKVARILLGMESPDKGTRASVFCLCGASMTVHGSLQGVVEEIERFKEWHAGEGHGPTDQKTCKRIRDRLHRERLRQFGPPRTTQSDPTCGVTGDGESGSGGGERDGRGE